jgi:hypothetical protein
MALQHLRSSTANKRPVPGNMSEGQMAMNTASGSPGLFFRDSNSNLVKVGPVHVGTTAPNASPASGGTAGNSVGEQWLDTSSSRYVFKIWDGSAWRSEAGEFVDVAGDVMTGALGIIAGSAGSPGLYFSGDANSGLYSPGADQVAISTNGTGRLFVDASGNVDIATAGSSLTFGGWTNDRTVLQQAFDSQYFNRIAFDAGGRDVRIQSNSADSTAKITFWTGASGTVTEKMRLDSSGRLGLGTSSPSQLLEVENSSGNVAINITSSDTGYAELYFGDQSNASACALSYEHSSNKLRFYNGGSARVTLDSSGNVGIGTTSPSTYGANLAVYDGAGNGIVSVGQSVSYAQLQSNGQDFYINAKGTGSTVFRRGSGDTESARIASDGAIYFQTTATPSTSSYGTVITSGNVFLHSRNTTSAVAQFYGSSGEFRVLGTGNVQNTNNSYGAISDAKLKENIEAAGSQWDDLKALEVVNFNFIGSDQRQIGLVAQQVELISPGLVEDVPDDEAGTTTTKGVKYSVLYMKAVKALQEAMERIEALEARIAAAGI